MSTSVPLHVTALWNSCAYGVAELHPGSSMNIASEPGVIHFSKSTMCPPLSRLAASPGCMSVHWMVFETDVSPGANSLVTSPGAASSHAHETNPEQSERYGSHCGLLWRLHVGEHDVSPSGCPLALWQYCSITLTHCIAFAMTVERVTVESAADVVPTGSLAGSFSWCSGMPRVLPGFDEHPAEAARATSTGATSARRGIMAIGVLCLSRATHNPVISRDVGAGTRGESLAARRGYARNREMPEIRKLASRCAFLADVYSPRVPMRGACAALLVAVVIAACNGSGGGVVPVVPLGPNAAMLDAYDAVVLASTESVAPTFAEVKEPRDGSPRRFRAWLGWNQEPCPPCTADEQNGTGCAPCPGPKPYVCARPSRVIACDGDDVIARTIEGVDDVPQIQGVYVFEAKWNEDGELVMSSITPIELPDGGASP
jgi:hypothetical protein